MVAAKRGRALLVRRKRDGLWMFPGGRKRPRESDKDCLRREIKEELPKLPLGLRLAAAARIPTVLGHQILW
jgi:8-oxo-dGTP diphosphatase